MEPTDTTYYVRVAGYIHIEPWRLPSTVFPDGADADRNKRVGREVFTEWFDLGKHGGIKLHGQLNRKGSVAELPNITADFVTSVNSLRGRS